MIYQLQICIKISQMEGYVIDDIVSHLQLFHCLKMYTEIWKLKMQ